MAAFKNADEAIAYFKAHLEVKHATKNGAYSCGRTIKPEGVVNHSVGCAQPAADVFFNLMNDSGAQWGVNYILGDFHKGEGRALEVLRPTSRPWGCASGKNGSWNNSRIQWEVCEPAGHTYTGGTMVNYDTSKNAAYFERMWKLLVALNVYAVVTYGFNPDKIADHAESYKAGYGSNHSDMGHWLPKHGKSMDTLRAEVKAILNGGSIEPAKPTTYNIAMPKLVLGSEGPEVKTLQRLLRMRGYKGADGKLLEIDGDAGANTFYAMQQFQIKMIGKAYTYWGKNSWLALLKS